MTALVAWLVILAEGMLAVAFLVGRLVDLATPIAGALILVFLAVVVVALRTRRPISCGCFANTEEPISRRTIVRLLVLLGVVAIIGVDRIHGGTPTGFWLVVTEPDARVDVMLDAVVAVGLVLGGAWMLNQSELLHLIRKAISGQPRRYEAGAGKGGR